MDVIFKLWADFLAVYLLLRWGLGETANRGEKTCIPLRYSVRVLYVTTPVHKVILANLSRACSHRTTDLFKYEPAVIRAQENPNLRRAQVIKYK